MLHDCRQSESPTGQTSAGLEQADSSSSLGHGVPRGATCGARIMSTPAITDRLLALANGAPLNELTAHLLRFGEHF
jgi:hypothetical protein